MSDLMAGNKKVIGWALGNHEFLNGNGAENLNIFYIGGDNNSEWNHQSFTIDMTKYFSQADAKYSDVQYYQIIVRVFYQDADNNALENNFHTPLLKRGEINNKRSDNEDTTGAMSVWFTDNTTLAVRTKSDYDDFSGYSYTNLVLAVYGFTSQDVGAGL